MAPPWLARRLSTPISYRMIRNENLPIRSFAKFFSQREFSLHKPKMSLLIPGLRRAATKLALNPFVYRQCLRQQPRVAPSRVLRSLQVRHASTESKARFARYFTSSAVPTGEAVINEAPKAGKKAFPETSSKAAGYWLIGSAVSVFGIVVFGGLTRLTESG